MPDCSQCFRFNRGNSTLVSTRLGSGVRQKMQTTRWIIHCRVVFFCCPSPPMWAFSAVWRFCNDGYVHLWDSWGWPRKKGLADDRNPGIVNVCFPSDDDTILFTDANFCAGSLSPAPIFNGWTQCWGAGLKFWTESSHENNRHNTWNSWHRYSIFGKWKFYWSLYIIP